MARSLFNKNKKRTTPLEMYTDYIVRRLQSNATNIDLSVTGSAEMKFCYDRIITSTSIREYYQLTRTAMYMPSDLISFLRTIEMDENYVGEGVSVNVCLKMEPHWINWNTREMDIRASVWEHDMAEAEEQQSQNTNKLVTDNELAVSKQNTWLQKSWQYFKEMCQGNHTTPVVHMYIELCTGVTNQQAYKNLKHAGLSLMQIAATSGFELKKIRGNLWDFQKLFSPASAGNPRMEKTTPRFPLTDTYISDITDYKPGKLSNTEILMGYDVDTGKMVYKDFTNSSGGAEVLLIAAVTGGGKSYFAKSISFNILLGGYTIIVLDRDGEYIPIADKIGGTVISMSKGKGLYYDSTVIADITGIEDTDSSLLIESQQATIAIFNVLADSEKGMDHEELSMFDIAYNRLYLKYGIDREDKYTWKNSRNLSYHKLYGEIKGLLKDVDNDVYLAENIDAIKRMITKFKIYFEPGGLYAYLFKQPISITDVLNKVDNNAPMVVLHMDLSDDTSTTKQDVPTLVKLITTNYLMNTILTHNRKLNKFTFEYIEEFQRYLYNTFAKGIIVTQVTGGRKKNANVIVVTNNPDELAESVVSDNALQAIRGNITSAMIGKINAIDSINAICTNLNLTGCESVLKSMLDYPDSYRNCFVSKYDSKEAAVLKAIVPPEYQGTELFKTRTLKEDVEKNG